MADNMRDMTRLCVYCADTKSGALVPRTLEETRHGREPNVVGHVDFLYIGESAVEAGIETADGFHYVLVILEDVSGYTWLRPSRACERHHRRACALVCRVWAATAWVDDNTIHFRNRSVRMLAK